MDPQSNAYLLKASLPTKTIYRFKQHKEVPKTDLRMEIAPAREDGRRIEVRGETFFRVL